ncbi:hypothetical protein METHP14_910015 [Pseudomonas sp. P14-2025]
MVSTGSRICRVVGWVGDCRWWGEGDCALLGSQIERMNRDGTFEEIYNGPGAAGSIFGKRPVRKG